MKVIDLLNKIANGEIDRNNEYQFSRDDYCTINDFFARYIVDEENLNLEILEEEKKIPKKLSTWFSVETKQSKELNIEYANTNFENMYEKINSIIDYLKSKGE